MSICSANQIIYRIDLKKRHVEWETQRHVECALPDVFHVNNNYVQKFIELHLF